MPQDEIEALLVSSTGLPGAMVVRLKGGDPFVFGRGGEEAEALRCGGCPVRDRAGRDRRCRRSRLRRHPRHPPRRRERGRVRHRPRGPFEAGVGLGLGGAGGVPGHARRSTWACGSCRRSPGADRWRSFVVRAGGGGRARHAARPAGGRGDAGDDRVRWPLIPASAHLRSWSSGAVAGLRERLAWFESRPLAGDCVAVTRARAQASGLAGRLSRSRRGRDRGAGDPDRAARRSGAVSRRVRPRVPDEPERSAPAVRAAVRRGARCSRSGGRSGRRDRAGDGGGPA